MTKYREILRLRSLGLSQNDIASSCHVSKKTVNRVLKLAQEHNLRWPQEESLTSSLSKQSSFLTQKLTLKSAEDATNVEIKPL